MFSRVSERKSKCFAITHYFVTMSRLEMLSSETTESIVIDCLNQCDCGSLVVTSLVKVLSAEAINVISREVLYCFTKPLQKSGSVKAAILTYDVYSQLPILIQLLLEPL